MLLYHGGVSWLPGGWLGVDAFFVLSGYLITTLLLAEQAREGRIGLGAFWGRRARRLLPALLLVVAAVLGSARWLLPADEIGPLRGDALAALGYVANWRMLDRGNGYAALTAAPSPLQHTWSLALEEQYYLIWPLLVVVVLALGGGRRTLLWCCGLGAVASAVAMACVYVPDADPARAYYGSDTRAFGLLVGCALGVVPSRRPGAHAAPPPRHRPLVIVAIGGLIWALATLDDAGPALYRGGLLLVVLAVAVVIAHAEDQPRSVVARTLSLRPLPLLGRVSYEIYLWHWPVFLALDHERTGLAGGTLLAVRAAATLTMAAATYRLISRPIRERRQHLVLLVGAMAAVAAAAVVLTIPPAPPGAASPDTALAAPALTSSLLTRAGRPAGPPRIAIFGDSVASSLAVGLPAVPGVRITNRAIIGCGIARSGSVRNASTIQRPYPRCAEWDRYWAAGVRADHPDLAVVVLARWEVLDRRFAGAWRHIGDPEYDAYLRKELKRMVDVLTADGARIVLTTAPYNHRYERRDGSSYPEDDPARIDAWNRMLADTARADPTRIRLVDLGARLCPEGRYTRDVGGVQVRSDGLHLTAGGVRDWVAPWLLPRLTADLR